MAVVVFGDDEVVVVCDEVVVVGDGVASSW